MMPPMTTTAAAAILRAANKKGMVTEERGRCSGSTTKGYEGEGYWKFNYKYGTKITDYPQAPGDASEGKGNIRRRAAGNVFRFSVRNTGARVRKRRIRHGLVIVLGTTSPVK